MTLEQAIDRVARKGGVRLSVFPASTGYQANFSADGKSYRVEMGATPLAALRKVLGIDPGVAGQMIQTGSVFE